MIEALIPELIGPHFGVLEQIEHVPPDPDDASLEVYAGRLANTAAFAALQAPQIASGAALDSTQAKAACVGEAVERYSAALPPPGAIVRCRADELSGTVVTPDRFALFASRQYRQPQEQFPFVLWNPSQPIGWTQARCLTATCAGSAVWLPATFVWLPYATAPEEPQIAPCLSTGLACGPDLDSATFSALCEVIERDALALAWLGKYAPPRIEVDLDNAGAPLRSIVDCIERRGLKWSLFDLTTDLGVTVAAALVDGNSAVGRIVSAGSACHPNQARAMCKALIEAAHCRMYVKSLLRRQPNWISGRRFRNVSSFADHARFYSVHSQLRRPLDRWRQSRQTRSWVATDDFTTGTDLNELVEQLAARGYDTYARNLIPPDIEPLGLSVARVIVPGLQPLHGNHAWPHLGGQRLAHWSRVFSSQSRRPLRWNRFPHPWA